MIYRLHIQRDRVGEAIRARFAMVIPIIRGMLYSTQRSIVEALGGYEVITFEQFARVYIEHPGDYGICFEYAVHQAIRDRDPVVHPLVSSVLEDFCGIRGDAESILFGAEKSGGVSVLETAGGLITDESRILSGGRGQPPFLKRHLDNIVQAFRKDEYKELLPQSISGLWKADLFIGSPNSHQWVATTLKTHKGALAYAPGLRIGLYPEEKRHEGPAWDEDLNMVRCPLPYNGEFMQLFGAAFQIVRQIVAAHGKQPSRARLVYDDDQEVAKWLTDRSRFPVLEVLEALQPLGQPGLLATLEPTADSAAAQEVCAPVPASFDA